MLVDCSWGFGNNGCDGGEEWRAYEWIMKHGGIATTETYGAYMGMVRWLRVLALSIIAFVSTISTVPVTPATSFIQWGTCRRVSSPVLNARFPSEQNGFCHLNTSQLTARVQSYTNVTSGDAEALKVALFKNGPVAVSIDASHRSFVFYSHGVYYEPACGKFPSHSCSYVWQQWLVLCHSLLVFSR